MKGALHEMHHLGPSGTEAPFHCEGHLTHNIQGNKSSSSTSCSIHTKTGFGGFSSAQLKSGGKPHKVSPAEENEDLECSVVRQRSLKVGQHTAELGPSSPREWYPWSALMGLTGSLEEDDL